MNAPTQAAPDPLHSTSGIPGTHWTTANVGEAMPGVQTPLSWSMWRGTLDRGMRQGAYDLGLLSAKERDDDSTMIVDIFYGRVAVSVNFFALLGDRSPGVRSEDIITTYFGAVPDDLALSPTLRRLPFVATRMPWNFGRQAGRVRRFAAEQDLWWTRQITALPGCDLVGARAALREARRRHEKAVAVQCVSTLVGIQPAYDALTALVRAREDGDVAADLSALSAVPGGPEMTVVADIWRASRGEIGIKDVLARHGFHGPGEGEARAKVWREDPTPLQDLINRYAAQDDSANPILAEARRRRARPRLETDFVRSLPAPAGPAARAVLAMVRARIPLRGVAKRGMLQSLDAARGATRRIGELLHAQGALTDVDDAFFLTWDELCRLPPDRVGTLAGQRRATHRRYSALRLPSTWSATPTPLGATTDEASDALITGSGVSSGVVEGSARVLLEPDFSQVVEGEILVAPVTDPSWCAAMFLASGLVVDVGGALSHAAVVARELGQPCVVNTRTGTTRIRTGDLIRVDGDLGEVTVLESASPSAAHNAEHQENS